MKFLLLLSFITHVAAACLFVYFTLCSYFIGAVFRRHAYRAHATSDGGTGFACYKASNAQQSFEVSTGHRRYEGRALLFDKIFLRR